MSAPLATADTTARFTVDVATYNVCKIYCAPGITWDERRPKVMRTIREEAPDLLAVQEAPTVPWRGTTQWADLTSLMRQAGYEETSDQDNCSEGCTRGAHLYYDPSVIRSYPMHVLSGQPEPPQPCMVYLNDPNLPEDKAGPAFRDWRLYSCRDYQDYTPVIDRSVGMTSQRQISGISWPGVQDRNVSWAYLQHIASGGVFLAVSLHLPNEGTVAGERARRAVAAQLPGYIEALNAERGMPGIPVIVLGDFNSYAAREARGAHWIFGQAGYRDAFTAAKRINPRFGTINITPKLQKWHGFPPRPHHYPNAATRIDYVFTTNGIVPLSHKVVMHLKNGRFDPAFQGSDHNMVAAALSVPVALP